MPGDKLCHLRKASKVVQGQLRSGAGFSITFANVVNNIGTSRTALLFIQRQGKGTYHPSTPMKSASGRARLLIDLLGACRIRYSKMSPVVNPILVAVKHSRRAGKTLNDPDWNGKPEAGKLGRMLRKHRADVLVPSSLWFGKPKA